MAKKYLLPAIIAAIFLMTVSAYQAFAHGGEKPAPPPEEEVHDEDTEVAEDDHSTAEKHEEAAHAEPDSHDADEAAHSSEPETQSGTSIIEKILPGLVNAKTKHPMFVHIPVAIWPVALLFWLAGLFLKKDHLWRSGNWLLLIGTAGALISVTSGIAAADILGHDAPGHDLVHIHRYWMFAATGLGIVTTVFAFLLHRRSNLFLRWVMVCVLVATVSVAVIGSDRGALLVYEYGMGTRVDAPSQIVEQHEPDEHSHD